MPSMVMELTERNLSKHDDRLAEIREKRMIDPNSEKFYRIWSWIRDVNEQLANGGHLTTPQHSRPSTARRRGEEKRQPTAGETSWDDGDDDDVEDLMGDDGQSRPAIPMALLNVTTHSAVKRADPVDSMVFIDDDVRAVDDDDYEPPTAPRKTSSTQKNTWANLASSNAPRQYQYQGNTPRQQQATSKQALGSRGSANAGGVGAYQNYPYGPTPSGKVVFVKPATSGATTGTHQSAERGKQNPNVTNNAMTPGAFYQALNRAAQRAAEHGSPNLATTAPAAVGRQHHPTQATPVTVAGERLRSAMSRRTAPALIPVNSQQHQASQVILKLHVSGEQLKPKALTESRSQASLVSSDPSGGTSKLSLPLMDRIKRITSKVKPQLKAAFGGSTNAIGPSSQSMLSRNSNIGVSLDSLARQDSLGGDSDAPRSPHTRAVRFVGVPPIDDDDEYDKREHFRSHHTGRTGDNGSILRTSQASKAPPNKYVQQPAQRIFRAFGAKPPGARPQDSPAPLQVTLV